MARTARRQPKGDICYVENIILWSWTTLNVHYESIEDKLNIDGGITACFSYVFKQGIILNES